MLRKFSPMPPESGMVVLFIIDFSLMTRVSGFIPEARREQSSEESRGNISESWNIMPLSSEVSLIIINDINELQVILASIRLRGATLLHILLIHLTAWQEKFISGVTGQNLHDVENLLEEHDMQVSMLASLLEKIEGMTTQVQRFVNGVSQESSTSQESIEMINHAYNQ